MTGSVSRAEFARFMVPAISVILGDSYKDYPEVYKQIFDVRSSAGATEELLVMSGLGLLEPVAEGGDISNDRMQQLFSINFHHAKYGKMLSVTQELIDDGKAVAVMERQARGFKKAALETKNKVAIDILNNSTTNNGYDGVPLVSTSHPTSAGNGSNRKAVDADLSESALEQCYIEMADIRDDRGLRLQVMPKKLVIPRNSVFAATRILESSDRSGTSDNDVNALRVNRIIPEVVVVDHLTDPNAYHIITDVEDGLIMYNRKELSIDSEPHFTNDAVQFRALMRFSVGWGDWRSVFASPGA